MESQISAPSSGFHVSRIADDQLQDDISVVESALAAVDGEGGAANRSLTPLD
jgi:hypothetical protein